MARRSLIAAVTFLTCACLFSYKAAALDNGMKSEATFLEFNLAENTYKADGQPIRSDAGVKLENGTVFIPLRAMAESLGYTVEWEQTARQVVIARGSQTITLLADSGLVYLQDFSTVPDVTLDAVPQIVDGHILVPACFAEECLNCQVYWNSGESTVLVASVGPGGRKIGADTMMAYLEAKGKSDTGAVIAVIDSGVDVSHTYLQDRIVQAYNVVEGNDNVYDESGHGTKVAGIIANCTPETVKIMPIKVDDKDGKYSPETIVKAIDYAVKSGVKVINISLNAALESDNRAVTEAVAEAVRQGCSVIVAAGNDSGDVLDHTPSNAGDAIVVTAVNENNVLWSGSNYGSTVVVTAPGVGVATTIPGSAYWTGEGTSMAAPYVAAAVAMVRMDIPGITPGEIRNLLLDYSMDLGEPGVDLCYGGGLLDLTQYVTYREKGVIGDLTKSAKEKIADLDEKIEALQQMKLKEHLKLYGLFWNPMFANDLNLEAQRLYETADYFAAGYYFEKALGFFSDNTARNNLAYMIRRGEYVSYQYTIRQLLDQAKADGNAHAYVNDALLAASKSQWEQADGIMGELCLRYADTLSMEEVVRTWNTLSYQKDAEGDLVLGWLMRYHVYTDGRYSQQELMERALEKYPTLPEWMKDPC